MKYEKPFIEIVKFQKENILLKASGDEDIEVEFPPTNPVVTGPGGGGDNPFQF